MNIHTPRRYEKRIIYNKYLQFLCIATVLSVPRRYIVYLLWFILLLHDYSDT